MDRKLITSALLCGMLSIASADQNWYAPSTQQTGSFTIQSGVPLQGTWTFAAGSTLDVTNATKIGFPSGGSGAVTSVFGRTGSVVAASNDYTFGQIGSKPTTLAGYGITDAEAALGNPGTSGWVLSSTTAGVRSWIALPAPGGSGTVTSFSSGDLAPLFTTSVANAASTPALSFTLSNASGNTWFGNASGLSGAPAFNASGDLTRTNDTNVTLTLGGTPTASLLRSVSLTLGWTGSLAIARGGTGATSAGTALSNLGGEPALGNPGTSGFVWSSTTGGVRSWVAQPTAFNPAVDASFTTAQSITLSDSGTTNAVTSLNLVHNSSGGASISTDFGVTVIASGQSTTTASRAIATTFYRWYDATDATRTGKIEFAMMRSGVGPTTAPRMFGDGSFTLNRNVPAGLGNIDISGVYKINGNAFTVDDLATTTTNDSAAAGEVGQTVASAIASTSAVSYTTGQTKNLTSISLTAGDWEVQGNVVGVAASLPANGIYNLGANIGTTTGTYNDDGYQGAGSFTSLNATASSGTFGATCAPRRLSLAGSGTAYLVVKAPTFASGTFTAYGFVEARRVR